jgi:hypothetical protein
LARGRCATSPDDKTCPFYKSLKAMPTSFSLGEVFVGVSGIVCH